MRPNLCWRFSRRARVRSALTVNAGVSSMKIGILWSVEEAAARRVNSSFDTSPLRMRSDEMLDCSERMRLASCSADISSEKNPTTAPSRPSLWL